MLPERHRSGLKIASILAIVLLCAAGIFTLLTIRQAGVDTVPGGREWTSRRLARDPGIGQDTAAPYALLGRDVHSADRQPGRLGKVVFGFFPHWMESRRTDIRPDYITHFCYFSYDVDPETGGPSDIHAWKELPLIDRMRVAGVRLILTASSFGQDRNRTLLANPAAKTRLIDSLVALCAERGAGGINIDFEIVPRELRDSLSLFMDTLASRLRTRLPGAQLSIDLPAVDREGAFDAVRLSASCDHLIVMGYDFHYAGSPVAGPVAPLTSGGVWRKEHVRGAVESLIGNGAAPEKILLGVPFYGYEWITDADSLGSRAMKPGKARFYSAIRNDALFDARRKDTLSGTVWSVAREGNEWRQVWFDDSASLAQKYRLVDSAGLGGVALWALGYEGGRNEIWGGILDAFLRVEKIDFESPFPIPPEPAFGFQGLSRSSSVRLRKMRAGTCLELALRDSVSLLRPWEVHVPLGNLLLLPRQGAVRLRISCSARLPGTEFCCLVRFRGKVHRTVFQPLSRGERWSEYLVGLHTLPDSVYEEISGLESPAPTLDGLAFSSSGLEPSMRIRVDDISTFPFPLPMQSGAGEMEIGENLVSVVPRVSGREIETVTLQRFDDFAGLWSTLLTRRIGRSQVFDELLIDRSIPAGRIRYRLVVTDRKGRRFPLKHWALDLRPKVLAFGRSERSDSAYLRLEIPVRGVYVLEFYSSDGSLLLRIPSRFLERGIRDFFFTAPSLVRNRGAVYFARVQSGTARSTSKILTIP